MRPGGGRAPTQPPALQGACHAPARQATAAARRPVGAHREGGPERAADAPLGYNRPGSRWDDAGGGATEREG